MTDREAMKLALEALECIYLPLYAREINKVGAAMGALRQALEQPEREWQGLTDEEEIELDEKYGDDFNAYIDARDAKLKEKNRG